MSKKKPDNNIIQFKKIKLPNTVLDSPPSDIKEDLFEEIERKYPDLENSLTDPDVLDRLSKVFRVSSAENKMGKFPDRLAEMIWKLVPKFKPNIDLYFTYKNRVYLICWKCLWVWAPIVESEERLPDNFGICPNGCNSTDGSSSNPRRKERKRKAK